VETWVALLANETDRRVTLDLKNVTLVDRAAVNGASKRW